MSGNIWIMFVFPSGMTQVDFDAHMTIHFEHICPHCDYKSRTEGRLKRHIKDFHTEDPDGGYGARTMPGRPKVFRCKQCEYSTTEKVNLTFILIRSRVTSNIQVIQI